MLHARNFSNDILSRIQLLHEDGALVLLQDTGLIDETIKQVGDGRYPDGDLMAKACRICGLSWPWIFEGTGAPYPVSYLDDESAAELLDELLAEISTVYLITTEDGRFCVQTSVPTRDEVQGKWIHTHSTELIAGDLGPATRKRLRAAKRPHELCKIQVSKMEFDRIAGGWQRLA